VPVTADTLFELGSCSKAFTALAVLKLKADGLLDLDRPVSHYLPWFFANHNKEKRPITLNQVLHHTSGIPGSTISGVPAGDSENALEVYSSKFYFYPIKNKISAAILILANVGATTESCRVASTNPVNIYGLLGVLRVVGAGLRARPFKISFS